MLQKVPRGRTGAESWAEIGLRKVQAQREQGAVAGIVWLKAECVGPVYLEVSPGDVPAL